MVPGGKNATYVEADALHLIVPGRTWQERDLAAALAARAMPSPFRPHLLPGWPEEHPVLPKTYEGGSDFLLVTRHGMLHSHHRTAEALSEWMAAGGWRVSYVDGISSLVRERGPRIAVAATASGLATQSGPIADCAAFCLRRLRFATDDEACASAGEALTAQTSAADFQPGDRDVHLAHVAAIATHIEREAGAALSPGAFADVSAARSTIMGVSGIPSAPSGAGRAARSMAERIYSRLTLESPTRMTS